MTALRDRLGALLDVRYPTAGQRVRARNAIVVLIGVAVVGLAVVPFFVVFPDARVAATTTLAVVLVAVCSTVLIRTGRLRSGLALFFAVLLVGNAVGIRANPTATAFFLLIPAGLAGVLLPTRTAVAYATLCAVLAVGAPLAVGRTTTMRPGEVAVTVFTIMVAVVVSTVLGGWEQRREAARADAVLGYLRTTNAELERRVALRTGELETALAAQRQLSSELAELSVRDPLTGLYNRRYGDTEVRRLLAEAARTGQEASFALVDLDDFKVVNDRFGYTAGDDVLRAFARVLSAASRASDSVVRQGGDEFLLVMPRTTPAEAAHVCERVRSAVADHDWSDVVPGLTLTASLGVAGSAGRIGATTLATAVDDALHRAKRSGRDRVVLAPAPGAADAAATS